jgi:2-polyprenyl-3-methyl-5-hydroxy-6-metoxy-1,4-benzoquinol methylase
MFGIGQKEKRRISVWNTFLKEWKFTPLKQAGLRFINEEFKTDFTELDFEILCRCSYMINLLENKTRKQTEEYHRNNIFMLTRLCSVIEDKYHQNRIKVILDNAKGRVLDFGGGLGDMSIHLTNKGLDVEYYDTNVYCRKFVQQALPSVKIVDKPTGVYDTIICLDTLPYIEDAEAFSIWMKSLLNKDGHFFIEEIADEDPAIAKMITLCKYIRVSLLKTTDKEQE